MTDSEHKRLNEVRRRYVDYATNHALDITSHVIEAWMDDIGFLLMRITELQTELWSHGYGDDGDDN